MVLLGKDLLPLAETIMGHFWKKSDWPTVLELSIDQDIVDIEQQIYDLRVYMYGNVMHGGLNSSEKIGIDIHVISQLSSASAQEMSKYYLALIKSCQAPFRANPNQAQIESIDVLSALLFGDSTTKSFPTNLPHLKNFLVSGVEIPSINGGIGSGNIGWKMNISEAMKYFLKVQNLEDYLTQRERIIAQTNAKIPRFTSEGKGKEAVSTSELTARTNEVEKVFISYSQETDQHKNSVLEFANWLRHNGVDCHIDRYETNPVEGWPRWMKKQMHWADYIVVVCTEVYRKRFDGEEVRGIGKGADWEGQIITQHLYDQEQGSKYIPVIFDKSDKQYIPTELKQYTYYDLSTQRGYDDLYRYITKQLYIVKPELGQRRVFGTLQNSSNQDLLPETEQATHPNIIELLRNEIGKNLSFLETLAREAKRGNLELVQRYSSLTPYPWFTSIWAGYSKELLPILSPSVFQEIIEFYDTLRGIAQDCQSLLALSAHQHLSPENMATTIEKANWILIHIQQLIAKEGQLKNFNV